MLFPIAIALSSLFADSDALPTYQSQAVSFAQVSPETALERLFTAPIQIDWFTEAFLGEVSVPEVERVITQLQAELGAYQSIESDPQGYRVRFAQGSVPAQITLNDRGQIEGLFFSPPAITLDTAVQKLQELPGQVNLLVLEDGSELAALNADQPLAVGSAFKLAVLLALQNQIEAGTYAWDQVVELQPEWRSLPSGILQDWAIGSPLTLQTLASLMISLSDNTATDALIHQVGREAVEAIAPRNQPFLTTREAFLLKDPQNSALLERYRSQEVASRRQILAELADYPLPEVTAFPDQPVALDVEWFFTARELCSLMADVSNLPVMSINPGIANPTDWTEIAYKGGSEPGVLNLTSQLKAANGKTYCVTTSWNNDATLDEAQLELLYGGILEALKQRN